MGGQYKNVRNNDNTEMILFGNDFFSFFSHGILNLYELVKRYSYHNLII